MDGAMMPFATTLSEWLHEPVFWAGITVVIVYAFIRFNQPAIGFVADVYNDTDPVGPARAFTTVFRYYVFALVYAGVSAMVYVLLILIAGNEELREFFGQFFVALDVSDEEKAKITASAPTWAASVLTIMLPSVRGLRDIDGNLRARLHKLAAIPFKAQGLAAEVLSVAYRINRNQSYQAVRNEFDDPTLVDGSLSKPDTPMGKYVRLRYLHRKMEAWAEQSSDFKVFLRNHQDNLKSVLKRVESLRPFLLAATPQAATCDNADCNGQAGPRIDDAVAGLMDDRLSDAYERMVRFLCCAVLYCERTEHAAYERLGWLGFRLKRQHARFDFYAPLYASVLIAVVTVFTGAAAWLLAQDLDLFGDLEDVHQGRILLTFIGWALPAAVMHTTVICGALVVKYWVLPDLLAKGRGTISGDQRFVGYLLIALQGWALGSAVALFFSVINPDWQLKELGQVLPWGLVSMATALCFSVLGDWTPVFRGRRLLDAVIQATMTLLASIFAMWLAVPPDAVEYGGLPIAAFRLLGPTTAMAIGFVLGFVLPSRYRLRASAESRTVAVVGAGTAGLTCAVNLMRAGYRVTVFEKRLNAGGRICTHRYQPAQFDLGAQYFTTVSDEFAERVEDWVSQGWAKLWTGEIVALRNGKVQRIDDRTKRYVALPTMNEIVHQYGERIGLHAQTQIGRVHYEPGKGCRVENEIGAYVNHYDHVVLAIPAPEAKPMLNGAGDLAQRLDDVRMSPCWAAAVSFPEPLELPFDAAFVNDADIQWIARDSSKPGRPDGENWVIHATYDWSEAHFDDDEADVLQAMLDEFWRVTGLAPRKPTFVAGCRWRYAAVRQALGEDFVYDKATGIGACGDWCLDGRVEAAWRSGRALAETIAAPVRWWPFDR